MALTAGYNVYSSQKNELALSDLILENVEALASYEIDFTGCVSYGCLFDYSYDCFAMTGGGIILKYCPEHRGF